MSEVPPFPKPDAPTSIRLRACVAGFALIGLAAIWRERDDLAGLIIHGVSFPILIWVVWIGTHRSPFLHRLWGVVCLIVTFALVAFVVAIGFGLLSSHEQHHLSLSHPPPSWLPIILGGLPLPVLTYLLLFDRRVAAFRQQLADRETHAASS
jgi:hypothetical protein